MDICGYCKNVVADGGPHIMRQQRREFECLPCRDCAFRRFGNNLPEETHWHACGIGETPHLIDSDLVETAAVTEVQGEPVIGKVWQRCTSSL